MIEKKGGRKISKAGIVIGIGMGGFVDGILLHQVLQWHNMLSGRVPPTSMEAMIINMRWDGIFHGFVWLVTLGGILMLWNTARQGIQLPSLSAFVGQLLFGWGWFNLVEGIIDHQILGIHHVREVAQYRVYDLTFLAVGGLLFILAGWLLMKRGAEGEPVSFRP